MYVGGGGIPPFSRPGSSRWQLGAPGGGGAGPGVGGAAARLSSSQWAGVAAGVERRRVGLWEARTPLTST